MMKMKKIIGFLVILLFVVITVPTMASAAEQYTDNLIPAMTDFSLPSGKVEASKVRDYTTYGYYAFDRTAKLWTSNDAYGYISYEFTKPQIICKYTIKPSTVKSGQPRDWTFEAWDGIKWIILDTRSNNTWLDAEKQEFIFTNNTPYIKYKLNFTASYNAGKSAVSVDEIEMMSLITPQVTVPTNLTATPGDTKVDLKWDAVAGATGYNVKRSETVGGPYVTISSVSGSSISYTDKNVVNGKTYYYVVTAVTANGESSYSNEVSATPTGTTTPSTITGNKAILVISFNNGKEKEYDLTAAEIDKFVAWYDAKSDGTGKSYFALTKRSNVKPFIGRKEYIKFDNIESFEIKDYNE